MMRLFSPSATVLAALAIITPSHATNVPVSAPENANTKSLANGVTGIQIDGPTRIDVKLPELSEIEKRGGGEWRGIVTVKAYGTSTGAPSTLQLLAMDAPAKEKLTSTIEHRVKGSPGFASWAIIQSSQQGNSAGAAFDNNPQSIWHSKHSKPEGDDPRWIGVELGAPQTMKGLEVVPRASGGNGRPKLYRLEVKTPGSSEWKVIVDGEVKKSSHLPLILKLPEPTEITAFRFVITKDWGDGFGSAAEIKPIGITLGDRALRPLDSTTAWLEIPADEMEKLHNGELRIYAKSVNGPPVIIGTPRFSRVPVTPTKKHMGKANGHAGPDKIGAGLLGFDALTVHQQDVLTVMNVRNGSPAQKAGLKQGDVIVATNGTPLQINNINPSWDWFYCSHEAQLGRAAEEAIATGKFNVPLTVIRDGRPREITIRLKRDKAFTTMHPLHDAQAAKLVDDMVGWLEKNQANNGSWGNHGIRTSLSGLALLATGDKDHEKRVGKAVEWAMNKFPTPEKYGNLGFWQGSYICILYSEWYLRTGDERVLPHLTALRDWAFNGQHPSKWDIPALGHGPDGLPYGEKALVAPACHLLVFEALAVRCGMESKVWELLTPYMEMAWSDPSKKGHGSLGYNPSYKDQGEFFSRSGNFALAAHLRGERPDMSSAMTGFMHERHPWVRNSHAYGEPGGAWGLLALSTVAPDRYESVIADYAWWFSLAWEPGYGLRFTTPHMGAPYMGEDELINAAYALVLQAPLKTLHITGKTVD